MRTSAELGALPMPMLAKVWSMDAGDGAEGSDAGAGVDVLAGSIAGAGAELAKDFASGVPDAELPVVGVAADSSGTGFPGVPA